ncbi:MAG: c-type cytochrome [Deltaproteobacteria bacterium]|nr:c-type cytochrome [Deltaproteobacteria bacterium]
MRSTNCVATLSLVLALTGCRKTAEDPSTSKTAPAPTAAAKKAAEGATIDKAQLAAYAPLPKEVAGKLALTDALIDLGRMLYFDKRLSKNHDVACNSCHDLQRFGVDGEATSPGHKKQRGNRNSPTVYNAAGHFVQFWDGREPTVEAQAKGPILNPVEMAMPNEAAVLKTLKSMPEYLAAFKKAFPEQQDPLTYDNVGNAIGAFERRLITPAPWDRFLAGEGSALTEQQKKGFLTFHQTGCVTCHAGAYLGGQMFQKLGLVKAWPSQKDLGRFAVTKNEAEKMMFKVPSLRNVAKTGPYFHDGSVKELGSAVRMMAEHQLGKTLSDAEVGEIVAFLGALTGEVPSDYIKEPKLPASTKATPKPDPS